MKRIFSIPLVIVLLCLPPCPAPAQLAQRDELQRSSPKVLAAFRDVVARPAKSLVRIQCDGKDVGLGTVVGAEGWVLTKASLLPPGSKIVCKFSKDRNLEAKVVGFEEPHDLALLKVEAKDLTPIEWKSSKLATPGDWVASPGTDKDPAGIGVVSVAARSVPARSYPRIIAAGGGFLGITGAPDEDADGVKVREVQAKSAADKAGIKPDDIIIGINDKKVKDIEDLQSILGRYKPNDTVTVRVKRDKEEKEFKATLGKRPPERADFQNNMGSRLSEKRTGFPNILQHDTVLAPTDCGGPLVDLDGKTVGINIARAGRVESYAIPSDTILALLNDLKSGKLPPRSATEEKIAKLAEKIAKLEATIASAEQKLADIEKKYTTAKAVVKLAEEAKKISDNDPDAVDVHRQAVKCAKKFEKEYAQARDSLEKARAELKSAQDAAKKESKEKK